jgi:DNA-binding transcriptional LysR family regulator
MLDVRRLRLLRELAHRNTIAAVAAALAYTPSAVSQQLSSLEREAGVRLLERSGRRVVLTPAALALVEHTEVVLERLEQASAALASMREGLSGPLRIGVFPSAARTVIPPALAALAVRHPHLEPRVQEIDPAAVGGALRTGELDVALVHSYDFVADPPEPGLDTKHLFDERMFVAAPRDFTSLPGEGDPLGRWRDAPWIVAPTATRCGTMTIRACEAAGFRPRVRHVVDDFSTVLALVGVACGVALVPQLATEEPVPDVVLTPVPMKRSTLGACRRGSGAHPAIAAFLQAVRPPAGRRTGHPDVRARARTADTSAQEPSA